MKIEKYTAKGKTKFRFQIYLGTDDLTGKPKQTRRSGFDSRKEAEIAYLKLMHEGEDTAKDRYRYIDIYHEWLDQYKLTIKSSTLNKTKEYFRNHILPSLGNYYVHAVKLKHAQRAVNDWSEKVVKFREIAGYASKVFDHAIRTGAIKDNPFQFVVYPIGKKTEKNEDNYYDKNELRQFLELAEQDMNPLWFTYFRLLAFTGMRKSEALALTWSDINFKESMVNVNKTLTVGVGNKIEVGEPKTGASNRVIHLDEKTISILRSWRLEQNKLLSKLGFKTLNRNQLVFATLDNNHFPLSNPNHRLNSLIKKHNLKRITVHGFRHTHCSMLFEAGASIPEVQKRLGHTDIKVTMNIYNHVSRYKQEEAIEKLADYLAF